MSLGRDPKAFRARVCVERQAIADTKNTRRKGVH